MPELASDFLSAAGIIPDPVAEKRILRVSFDGTRAASQAADDGSIPFTRPTSPYSPGEHFTTRSPRTADSLSTPMTEMSLGEDQG